MSKQEQKISPLRMPKSASKPYQTPARYLVQPKDIIYEEEYYKQRCQRLQKQVTQLNDHIRIVETQNKQLKTQIQFYRQTPQSNHGDKSLQSPVGRRNTQQSEQPKMQQVGGLLKQIRLLKNNHQVELNSSKAQQKRLSKRISQLQQQLRSSQSTWQAKCQQGELSVQQRNKTLQKQLKDMRKSAVTYMQQRDQSQQMIQKLKSSLQAKNQEISQLLNKEKQLLDEKEVMQERMEQQQQQQIGNQQEVSFKDVNIDHLAGEKEENDDFRFQSSPKSQIRESRYGFQLSNTKRDKIRQSQLSILTFNGARHVPAEEAFQLQQSLKNEIHRLQNEIQQLSLSHLNDTNDLNHLVERCQKDIKEKDNDLVSLLTKVKPLLLEKHKMTTKENVAPKDGQQQRSFEEERENMGKNAFGLRMLQLYLKKYKMETL